MSINKKEFSTKKKFGYTPTKSPTLNKNFDKNSKLLDLANIKEKQEYLKSLGIHPEFAMQLNTMFEKIKASTVEIVNYKSNIVAANDRISEQVNLSRSSKTNLVMMKEAA